MMSFKRNLVRFLIAVFSSIIFLGLLFIVIGGISGLYALVENRQCTDFQIYSMIFIAVFGGIVCLLFIEKELKKNFL